MSLQDAISVNFKVGRLISDCRTICPAVIHRIENSEPVLFDLSEYLKNGRKLDSSMAHKRDAMISYTLWSRR